MKIMIVSNVSILDTQEYPKDFDESVSLIKDLLENFRVRLEGKTGVRVDLVIEDFLKDYNRNSNLIERLTGLDGLSIATTNPYKSEDTLFTIYTDYRRYSMIDKYLNKGYDLVVWSDFDNIITDKAAISLSRSIKRYMVSSTEKIGTNPTKHRKPMVSKMKEYNNYVDYNNALIFTKVKIIPLLDEYLKDNSNEDGVFNRTQIGPMFFRWMDDNDLLDYYPPDFIYSHRLLLKRGKRHLKRITSAIFSGDEVNSISFGTKWYWNKLLKKLLKDLKDN